MPEISIYDNTEGDACGRIFEDIRLKSRIAAACTVADWDGRINSTEMRMKWEKSEITNN